jgi:hypothetical protein
MSEEICLAKHYSKSAQYLQCTVYRTVLYVGEVQNPYFLKMTE